MTNMIVYTSHDLERDAAELADQIRNGGKTYDRIYAVPHGGIPVALALIQHLGWLISIVSRADLITPQTLIVDDIVDSGTTRNKFPHNDFACLHVKAKAELKRAVDYTLHLDVTEWVQYFWEGDEPPAGDAVIRMIEAIGDDPNRKGVVETPERVVRSWSELYAGYHQNPADEFKEFEDEIQYGGLVALRKIEFYSMCEHHMLPFAGEALIAYIPDGPVLGTSKMARLLDIYARRLQMQERIGEQVVNALMNPEHGLEPAGAACLIEAKHLCIACRGVKKQHSLMDYHALRGVFLEHSDRGIAARQELMTLWAKP